MDATLHGGLPVFLSAGGGGGGGGLFYAITNSWTGSAPTANGGTGGTGGAAGGGGGSAGVNGTAGNVGHTVIVNLLTGVLTTT